MNAKRFCRFVALALLLGAHQAAAHGAQYFRVSGPAATTIISFNPDGTLVWSNAQQGATYTVQTVSTVPGGTSWVDYVQLPVTNAVNTNLLVDFNPPAGMALIPAGTFTMGNTIGDSDITDAVPTSVTVSAFYMDTNLVSYSQWQGVYTWATNNGYGFNNAGAGKAANHPVQTVDWYDCVKWCNARSQQAGLTPVYYTDVGLTQVYTNGDNGTTVYPSWAIHGYRLPTEAEWEKAARGGLSGQRFPWGDTILLSQANYFGCTTCYSYDLGPSGHNVAFVSGGYPYTSPGGSFAPNGYGLYDMAGNVEELCWDWFGTSYAGGTDPRGPATGIYRVSRGGDWSRNANLCRTANRNDFNPAGFVSDLGFRSVRSSGQ